MKRLNTLLDKNDKMNLKLKDEYYNIQNDFIEKLKELEMESVNLEVEIDRRKEEKAELLAGIVECERQVRNFISFINFLDIIMGKKDLTRERDARNY